MRLLPPWWALALCLAAAVVLWACAAPAALAAAPTDPATHTCRTDELPGDAGDVVRELRATCEMQADTLELLRQELRALNARLADPLTVTATAALPVDSGPIGTVELDAGQVSTLTAAIYVVAGLVLGGFFMGWVMRVLL